MEADMVTAFRDYMAQLTPFPITDYHHFRIPTSDIHAPPIWENVAPTAKPRELSPAEVVYIYCQYNLWIARLSYDTAQAKYLVFTLRKVKNKLSSTEREVMQKLMRVAYKSVSDDMTMVAKLGTQSRELTSSKYFVELRRILGMDSVSVLRLEFGTTIPKELRSWRAKIFRWQERRLVKNVEESHLRLLFWRYIFENSFHAL
jgi:hypothetical protein